MQSKIESNEKLSFDSNKKIEKYKNHSPSRATLYSTFIPGAGQLYNKQAWKIPIIYVGEGIACYFAVTNYNNAQKFKKEYKLRVNQVLEGRNPDYANYPDQSIYNLYYAYEKNFELSIMVMAGVYLLNIIDAMVYGHLFNYDISPDLSLRLTPYCMPDINNNVSTGIMMSLKF